MRLGRLKIFLSVKQKKKPTKSASANFYCNMEVASFLFYKNGGFQPRLLGALVLLGPPIPSDKKGP